MINSFKAGHPVSHTTSNLLTPTEAAAFLKVESATLASWRSNKRVQIPFSRVGKLVRYNLNDLENYIKRHLVAANTGSQA